MTSTIHHRPRHFFPRRARLEPNPERPFVVVPTASQGTAIVGTLARIRVALPDADILVVDDRSDGTADIAERLARHLGHIFVLRDSDDGAGTAREEPCHRGPNGPSHTLD